MYREEEEQRKKEERWKKGGRQRDAPPQDGETDWPLQVPFLEFKVFVRVKRKDIHSGEGSRHVCCGFNP